MQISSATLISEAGCERLAPNLEPSAEKTRWARTSSAVAVDGVALMLQRGVHYFPSAQYMYLKRMGWD